MSDAKNVHVTRDERAWEIELRGELPREGLARHREQVLKEMQKDAKLDGFRPGHAPIERIVAIYGEGAIEKRAIERAIQAELPELLAAEKAPVVEAPRVSIEPPEAEKPVRFSARAALAPAVALPDYKTIAKKNNAEKEEVSVSDDEHREALTHFRRERARIEKVEKGADAQKAAEEARAMDVKDLPELDDAFVKALGIENMEKFSETVRASIKNEKEIAAREKRRAVLLDELIAESKINYPAMLKTFELDDIEARLKHDLERMSAGGGEKLFEGYLQRIGKTREDLRKEWDDAADKRAKVRLVLAEIARAEAIEPNEERLQKEIENAKKHAPNADPKALRAHIAHALRNEKTIEFLEQQ